MRISIKLIAGENGTGQGERGAWMALIHTHETRANMGLRGLMKLGSYNYIHSKEMSSIEREAFGLCRHRLSMRGKEDSASSLARGHALLLYFLVVR